MAAERHLTRHEADNLLKAMLIFSRTVDHVLESRAIEVTRERLSKSKVQILRLLDQRGPQASTQIARFLGTSKPAVTQMIDALVQGRLVTRKQSSQDRRGIVLSLTNKGRACFGKVLREQRHLIRSTARQWRNNDLDRAIKSLQEMSAALARADRTFQHFCLQCGAHGDKSCVLVGGGANCPFLKSHDKPKGRARS